MKPGGRSSKGVSAWGALPEVSLWDVSFFFLGGDGWYGSEKPL